MSTDLPKPREQYDYNNEVETRRLIEDALGDLLSRRSNWSLQPDQTIEVGTGRIVLTSPDGSRFVVTVDNSGVLSTTAL